VLADLAERLQPLGQMAESAGSLFGLRPFASLLGSTPPPPAPARREIVAVPAHATAARKSPAKKAPPKKAAAKKTATKKASAAKRAPAKKR
jgi:hypothetical protein